MLLIYQEDPQSRITTQAAPQLPWPAQAFYDWHEVNRLVRTTIIGGLIPDGSSPGGAGPNAGLDLLRNDCGDPGQSWLRTT